MTSGTGEQYQFPSRNEFLNFTLTQPFDQRYYVNITSIPVSYNNLYYWSAALLTLFFLAWLIFRTFSHALIFRPRVPPSTISKNIPGGKIYLSREEERDYLKEQLFRERLTGLRYLVPVDWIAKNNVRSLCVLLLFMVFFLAIAHNILYATVHYAPLMPASQENSLQNMVVNNKILNRFISCIYYPNVGFWMRDFFGMLLGTFSEDLIGTVSYLSLITLRPIIYIIVGQDMDLVEYTMSLSKCYALFSYGIFRTLILSLIDLFKSSFHATGEYGSFMAALNEYLLPFAIDRTSNEKAQSARQEKLVQLRKTDPALFENFMKYKESLHEEVKLPRSLILPFLVDSAKRLFRIFDTIVFIFVTMWILLRLRKFQYQLKKACDSLVCTKIEQREDVNLLDHPPAMIRTLLGLPVDEEDDEGSLKSLDVLSNLHSADRRISNRSSMDASPVSSRITSTLGSTDGEDSGKFGAIQSLQENGFLGTSIHHAGHLCNLLWSFIVASVFHMIDLCIQGFLPLAQPHQDLLTKHPLIADIIAISHLLILAWMYLNLVLLLVPAASSRILYIIQDLSRKLEESGVYYNSLESIFFRLHRLQSTVFYEHQATRPDWQRKVKESWIDKHFNLADDEDLKNSNGEWISSDLDRPNDMVIPRKPKSPNRNLPAWVDRPIPQGMELPPQATRPTAALSGQNHPRSSSIPEPKHGQDFYPADDRGHFSQEMSTAASSYRPIMRAAPTGNAPLPYIQEQDEME